jgi:Kef-type K+ transport system membrane component KefB
MRDRRCSEWWGPRSTSGWRSSSSAPRCRRGCVRGELTPDRMAWLLVLVLLSSLAANALGLSLIVGGFVAGVVVPDRADLLESLRRRLLDVSAFILLPVFLAVSGLRTDFRTLEVGSLVGLAALLVAGVVAKWPATALAARATGLSWRESHLLGVLMNCRGFMVLAVSLVALEAGRVTPQLQAVAVVMALVTTVMTGPLVDRLRR